MPHFRAWFLLFLAALVMTSHSQESGETKKGASNNRGQGANSPGSGENNASSQAVSITETLEAGDGSVDEFKDNICEDIERALDEEERQGVGAGRSKRSAYYGGYVDYGRGYGDFYGSGYGGYGGYGVGNRGYGGGYDGGYDGGYGGGYGQNGKLSYDQSYSKSPVLTFVKGFKPGKSYVEKGRVVRNYYRHGTYEVALQHYKFIPVIKVVPYTTYDTIGYTGHIQAHNDYTAHICRDCYYGYPKIDVVANKAPYNHLTRRFVYLPENYHIDGYDRK